MEDENSEKAKQACEFTRMQERAKKLQEQFSALSNKVYKGKRQGINIQMKGDYQVLDITIDQSFYETSSKTQMEQALMICLTNLKQAIDLEQEQLKNSLQTEINKFQIDMMKEKENGQD